MIRHARLLPAGLACLAWALPARPSGPPNASAGPYHVSLDRVTHNRNMVMTYDAGGIRTQRSLQLQLRLAGGAGAPSSPAIFRVNSVTAEDNGQPIGLSYSASLMSRQDTGSLLQVYVSVASLPPLARELRSIEGEIVVFKSTRAMQIDLPLTAGSPAAPVEREGVRVVVREMHVDGLTARAVIEAEGPEGSSLLHNPEEPGYGVGLIGKDGRPIPAMDGTLEHSQPNRSEYRVRFRSVVGPPTAVRLRLVHRGGGRSVYPFRLEKIAIPERPIAGSQPGKTPKQ